MKAKNLGILVGGVVLAACGSAASSNSSTFPTTAPTSHVQSSLSSVSSKYGKILASSSGYVYYMFQPDSPGKSTCYSSCEAVWPPVTTMNSNISISGGVHKSLVSVFTRTDGTKQIQYNGHPLYTYEGDTGPKLANGQGVNSYGGYWYVINTAGTPIASGSSAPSSTSGASSAPYSAPSSTSGASPAPYSSPSSTSGASSTTS